ncbi:MAG: mannose-1-phosphate guanylyltransferase [Bacteroidaceae bacterium]|nr:mannose-1-phosphate guanylyltransferase [Bacteroidaceae bacterium]
MTSNKKNYVLILAGGKGRRLWPVSREAMPKQFLDFFSTGKTQLQQTWERAKTIVPVENIYVSTNNQYGDITREQLPEALKENILVEPIFRNTAPSVAWATYRIFSNNPEGNLAVMPSDQAVIDERKFVDSMLQAFDYVSGKDILLTVGVTPTRPEPGYGYVQVGEPVPPQNDMFFRVKSFTEKPNREFAKMFMESGEFLWNTGMFCASVQTFRKSFMPVFPHVFRSIEGKPEYRSIEKELDFVNKNFTSLPNMSIEKGVLSHSDSNYVMHANFGWTDLGTWHSIYESMNNSDSDNVTISSNVLFDESKGNIVKLPKDHIAIIGNLDGYIVAEKGNVLLICKKEDSSALIKKYRNEVQMEFGQEFV